MESLLPLSNHSSNTCGNKKISAIAFAFFLHSTELHFNMMNQHLIISFSFLVLLLNSSHRISAQSPAQAPSNNVHQTPAQAPTKPAIQAPVQPPTQATTPGQAPSEVPLVQAPPRKAKPEPTNVTKILDKAGGFSVFIRILRSTQVINQIENQLNVSNSLTILAPINGAFSSLKPGTLNSLTTEQKVQLVQYHILPSFVSLSNFQTLSNPVRTQASNTDEYPLNITTQGNWVNISTGLVNTSISGTVYADSQLAIYKLDRVLLPLGIFAPRPKAPAPAPAVPKPNKGSLDSSSSSSSESSTTDSTPAAALLNASGAHSLTSRTGTMVGSLLAVVLAVFSVWIV
ncbi:FAS1 domain containing protein [Parasponia andersonii]|uniref:FAS1 domain containing protein n=1 Tax=Parasponia andersonii TaxID=3476 RepID=A0A2P5DEY5_PARAD|nr:FAS1 domain containing protein [Parasponia andersonii]